MKCTIDSFLLVPRSNYLEASGGGGNYAGCTGKFCPRLVSKEHFLRHLGKAGQGKRARSADDKLLVSGIHVVSLGVENVFKENAVLVDMAFPIGDSRFFFCSNLFIRSFGAGEK